MASRVSKITAALYSTSGLTRVSKITASARVIPPAILRISSFKLTAYVQDELTPIRVSSLHANAWGSLDQGLYLSGDLFGSNEVFAPVSFTSTFQLVSPPVPDVEVNPYRADVPNVDQQRIMREQHNLAQAGDSTFHWGVLTDIYAEPKYTLGSLGRFYHDQLGMIHARFVKFVDLVKCNSKGFPVGWHTSKRELWTVTNQLSKSSQLYAVGVAIPYNELAFQGDCYGWVIVDGLVPVEMDIALDSTPIMFGTEYGWSDTGKVKPSITGYSLGIRFTTEKLPTLPIGTFKVELEKLSQVRLAGIITTKLAPLSTALGALTTRVSTLETTVGGHTTQISGLTSRVDALELSLASEIKSLSDSLAQIRRQIPDSDFVGYVNTAINNLKGYVDANNTVIGTVANNALLRANAAYALAESTSYAAVQAQIDAINTAMGGITDRLIGFTANIDTNTLTAGQVLVSYLYATDAFGVKFYDFRPLDFEFNALLDVDVSTPPTDGQVPIWDNAAQKWIPGDMTGGGGGGGGSSTPWYFDPPLASSFTLLTSAGSNAALTDDPDVGLLIDPVNYDGTPKVMYRTLTDKTLDWSCVARFTGFMFAQNYASYGIHLQDSVGGRCLRNNMTNNVGIAATKMNSLNAYNSEYFTSGVSPGIPGALWLRMDRVGTNLHWMVSGDGKIWRTYNTQTVTDFLTNAPDRVGLLVASNANGLMVSCAHFSLTGPAV